MTVFLVLLFLALFGGVIVYSKYQRDVFIRDTRMNNRKIMNVNNMVGESSGKTLPFVRSQYVATT